MGRLAALLSLLWLAAGQLHAEQGIQWGGQAPTTPPPARVQSAPGSATAPAKNAPINPAAPPPPAPGRAAPLLFGSAAITVSDGAKPVAGATVKLAVEPVQTGMTDASGKATFPKLTIGTYSFTVALAGYFDVTGTVTVTTGATATGTAVLKPAATIVMRALDDTGHSFAAVPIATTVSGTARTLTTDSSGVANFTQLPAGSYTFTVTGTWQDHVAVGPSSVSVAAGERNFGSVTMKRVHGAAVVDVNCPTPSQIKLTVNMPSGFKGSGEADNTNLRLWLVEVRNPGEPGMATATRGQLDCSYRVGYSLNDSVPFMSIFTALPEGGKCTQTATGAHCVP